MGIPRIGWKKRPKVENIIDVRGEQRERGHVIHVEERENK
jgi:hypothetical protein